MNEFLPRRIKVCMCGQELNGACPHCDGPCIYRSEPHKCVWCVKADKEMTERMVLWYSTKA